MNWTLIDSIICIALIILTLFDFKTVFIDKKSFGKFTSLWYMGFVTIALVTALVKNIS